MRYFFVSMMVMSMGFLSIGCSGLNQIRDAIGDFTLTLDNLDTFEVVKPLSGGGEIVFSIDQVTDFDTYHVSINGREYTLAEGFEGDTMAMLEWWLSVGQNAISALELDSVAEYEPLLLDRLPADCRYN